MSPGQVLITTGSQQGLDLCGRLLLDAGSRVLVETPTFYARTPQAHTLREGPRTPALTP